MNSVVSNVPKRNREGLRLIGPVIEARRKAREEQGDDYPGKPVRLCPCQAFAIPDML